MAQAEDTEAQAMMKYQPLAKITFQQALDTAEAAYGSSATDIELDEEGGSLTYEVGFADGTEINVDAGNRKILILDAIGIGDMTKTPVQGSIQMPANKDD